MRPDNVVTKEVSPLSVGYEMGYPPFPSDLIQYCIAGICIPVSPGANGDIPSLQRVVKLVLEAELSQDPDLHICTLTDHDMLSDPKRI